MTPYNVHEHVLRCFSYAPAYPGKCLLAARHWYLIDTRMLYVNNDEFPTAAALLEPCALKASEEWKYLVDHGYVEHYFSGNYNRTRAGMDAVKGLSE